MSILHDVGHADINPCRGLSKSTRAKSLKPTDDSKLTPYVESIDDVIKIYRTLLKKWTTVATAYAIGALAGLRTGEVRALKWEHVDLDAYQIHVQVQVERRKGRDPSTWSVDGTQRLKDGDPSPGADPTFPSDDPRVLAQAGQR